VRYELEWTALGDFAQGPGGAARPSASSPAVNQVAVMVSSPGSFTVGTGHFASGAMPSAWEGGIMRVRWRMPGAWLGRGLRWARSSWIDIAWVIFVGLNLAAMRLMPVWQTVPFLVIWVSLTLIYGFRLWRLQPAILTLAAVTLATGGIIAMQVIEGQQDADYLAEVPLIALMFVIMVWNGRRRLAAMEERLAAMEEVQRISRENLRLLEQQRLFLLDASHELGTPITVALGHAELIERATTDKPDKELADDARVVVGELGRLRRLASRLLLLASAGNPGFLDLESLAADSVMIDALGRWGYAPRVWRLGELAETVVHGDRDRLAVALDALLENAVAHTEPGDRIELSARARDGQVVLTVEDAGCGIDEGDLERIFGRFSRARPYRSREAGGFGLGLPVVQAIAEAHHGSVRVRSTVGRGSTFELVLPTAQAPAPVRDLIVAGGLRPASVARLGLPSSPFHTRRGYPGRAGVMITVVSRE
jgi:two-component system, OmpR family, sensor kinase